MFPDCEVLQDIKHLINRIVEKLSKRSDAYGAACKALHEVVGGGAAKMSVRSRNGNLYQIERQLADPATMERKLDEWLAEYRALDQEMFLPGFDEVLNGQRKHIRCDKEA